MSNTQKVAIADQLIKGIAMSNTIKVAVAEQILKTMPIVDQARPIQTTVINGNAMVWSNSRYEPRRVMSWLYSLKWVDHPTNGVNTFMFTNEQYPGYIVEVNFEDYEESVAEGYKTVVMILIKD